MARLAREVPPSNGNEPNPLAYSIVCHIFPMHFIASTKGVSFLAVKRSVIGG
ncbi:MAG: hypothetical protein LBU32_13870 [Clostridiales bacterium]|nr:hypothetical protein [Clostridiales bacterium]